MRFLDRSDAGRRLARLLGDRDLSSPLVLALPRGGVPVALEIALALGVTAEAALQALRRRNPRMLVLAVPVCPPEKAARLRQVADEVVCAHEPISFHAVGQFYERFDQTSDEEVLDLLARASARTEVTT